MSLAVAFAFTLGLLSSLHCIGMCGGIVSALACSLPTAVERNPLQRNGYVLLFNLGRILTYSLLGAVVGAGGDALVDRFDPMVWRRLAAVIAGIGLLLIGGYLGGWVPAVRRVDLLGRGLWRRLERLGRRLLPIRSPLAALATGAVWGWLPCGLVYYALLAAAPLADPLAAATFMAAFGLGTLPSLQAAGLLGGLLIRFARDSRARTVAATAIALLGLAALLLAWTDIPHDLLPFYPPGAEAHHGHH